MHRNIIISSRRIINYNKILIVIICCFHNIIILYCTSRVCVFAIEIRNNFDYTHKITIYKYLYTYLLRGDSL